MYERLSLIDALTRPHHYHLSDTDTCYYFGDYTARKGHTKSHTNDLIINFKKSVDRQGKPEYKYKLAAIQKIASNLNQHFIAANQVTFIPIPPSKSREDSLYDNRIVKVLDQFRALNSDVDYRDFIIQSESTEASHNTDSRLSPEEL